MEMRKAIWSAKIIPPRKLTAVLVKIEFEILRSFDTVVIGPLRMIENTPPYI